MVKQEIVYCSDLIKALKEYVKEYGNDRILGKCLMMSWMILVIGVRLF